MHKHISAIFLLISFATSILIPTIANASVIFYTSKTAFDTASSTTLLETFENVSPTINWSSSFVHNGVTYTGTGNTNVGLASPGYTNFGAGVGTTTSTILTANGNEDFMVTFSALPYSVGFDTYFNGLGPVTVKIFGSSGLLDSIVFPGSLNNKGYLGFVSSEAITSFRWTATNGGSLNTGIDNLSVSNAAVPEPATWLLIGFGLASIGLLRKRKSKIENQIHATDRRRFEPLNSLVKVAPLRRKWVALNAGN